MTKQEKFVAALMEEARAGHLPPAFQRALEAAENGPSPAEIPKRPKRTRLAKK